MREILSKQFYLQDDVTHVARSLLGMVLVRSIGHERISGKIIETEAYKGFSDKASHSYLGKKQKEMMRCMKKVQLHTSMFAMEFTLF